MVLSYEPVKKNRNNNDDPNADSSEIEFMNPYLIVGVENLLWYGEILDNLDITVEIDQESDGEKPRTFEERYPMLAQMLTTTIAPNVSPTNVTTTPSPNQLKNDTMAAIFSTLFSNASDTKMMPLDTSTRTPLAPIPENPFESTDIPSFAKPDANETEKLYQLLQLFSTMQKSDETSKPGEQKTQPEINFSTLLAEFNNSSQPQSSQSTDSDLNDMLKAISTS